MTTRRSGQGGKWTALALALAVTAVLGVPALANSQVLYGSVTGTVQDPQGAALPGVTVVATNTGTSLKVEAVTDGTGSYTFRNLPPGTYDISASLTGFKELHQRGLNVTAGNPIRVDLKLDLGNLAETVEVTAATTIIQTERADLSTELTAKQVVTLPLNQYRNYQQLVNLVPGATPAQTQNAEIDTPGRSLRTWVNGVQPNSNTTRVDGAVSVNIWLPHHVGYVQPAETIETVNIATNNFDADQGMAGGAAQTVVTKSGTNQFRGSAFWFNNSDELTANTYSNEQFDIAKPSLNTNIYGGTLGGPIVKNKFFFFGSYEMFRDRRGRTTNYTVPTARMRNGDFGEVAAAYPAFRLFNPFTGGAGGVGREQFANFQIPGNLISPVARAINAFYPNPVGRDLDNNNLLDDFTREEPVEVDRANYDLKLTFQRSNAHSIWGKFSMLDAEVVDNYMLGFENGSLGDTRVYVGGLGHTWTLSPTLVLDGNFGYNRQDQTVTGPDYGTNFGLDFGIRGVNDPNDIRASGFPRVENGYSIGQPNSWMPLFRKEITYTFSSALTKVFTKHEMRGGVDVVRLELNHRQAEFGNYGLRGGFSFGGSTGPTGAPGYISPGWNNYASFLLGLPNFYGKDVQTEDMTGREWQSALYIRDRWRVNNQLTINLGARLEYYPLMTRANSGIERLDYDTYTVILGGRGGQPTDPGINLQKWYFAPRLGATYRLDENSVVRAGYGRTINPLPWSRPMRGSFPYDVFFNNTAEQYAWLGTLEAGIPQVPIPDFSSGQVKLPLGVFMRSPNPGREAFPGSGDSLDRAVIQQWNVAFERKLAWDIAAEIAYVGTRTDGGYADLNINYGELGGGNASRQYFAVAGNTAINDWASRTKSRYHGLQLAVNRPFLNGLMIKAAYTYSRAKDMTTNGEDGWVGLAFNHPALYDKNFTTAVFDRPHNLHVGFSYELPFFREDQTIKGTLLGGWMVSGVLGVYSGTPYSIGGTNSLLNCPSCGNVYINYSGGDPKPVGDPGSTSQPYYDKSLFAQPTGLSFEGFGNTNRTTFRQPMQWNADMSFFKAFRIGRAVPELRIQVSNLFNTVNWGAPNTSFTSPNFLLYAPGNAIHNPRRMQIGVRVGF